MGSKDYEDNRACCCCGLRTAASVFVYLSLINAVLSLLICVTLLATSPVFLKDQISPDYKEYVTTILIIATVISLVVLVVPALAVHGLRKYKHKLLLPWICYNYAVLILNIVVVIAQLCANRHKLDTTTAFVYVCITIGTTAIGFYIVNIVRRYYVVLRNDNENDTNFSANPKQGGGYPMRKSAPKMEP